MPSPSKTAVLGWVLVSYFMIAGGFALAAVAITLVGETSRETSGAVFFIGSLIGGLFAGRASRHKAVVEPAIAALLVVATLFGVFAVGLGRRLAWTEDGGALRFAVELGLVAGLGGLVGGLIGRRSRHGAPVESAVRWWGIAILINLGTTFMLVSLLVVLVTRSGAGGADPGVAGILAGLVGAWLVGGLVAQAVAPRRMCWVCGAGSIGIILLGMSFSARHGELAVGSVVGALLLWGIGTLVGALGALIGWKLIASRAPHPAASLPEVRVRS
jgi:hypothetical protein